MEGLAGIVVAGGKSRRLGQDKRRLRLWGDSGPTLLEHTVGLIAPFCSETLVVLNDGNEWPQLSARRVPDLIDDAGALGGIYSGLRACQADYALVVAADMPLLQTELIQLLVDQPRDYQALVPRAQQQGNTRNRFDLEPLLAIYARSALPVVEALLDAGERRISDLFSKLETRILEPEDWSRVDPSGRSFRNINRPDDLALVQAELAKTFEA
jgi:molybdopterin-guanine dinucleotide biosynthesis protein A